MKKSSFFKSILITSSTAILILNYMSDRVDAKDYDYTVYTAQKSPYSTLYSDNGKAISARLLPPQTDWRVGKRKVIGVDHYYQIATHEWVNSKDGYENFNPDTGELKRHLVGTIKNPVTTIYNNNGQKVGTDNSKFGINSKWKVDQVIQNKRGKRFFRVASNMYISSSSMGLSEQPAIVHQKDNFGLEREIDQSSSSNGYTVSHTTMPSSSTKPSKNPVTKPAGSSKPADKPTENNSNIQPDSPGNPSSNNSDSGKPLDAQKVYEQTINSLPEPKWIFNSGMSKGKYHDRQDLGFILRENKVLKVRQINPKFKDKLTLRLLGNDSQTEKSVDVGADWVSISSTDPLVPFIDTPYGNQSAQIEFKVEDTKAEKPLPIYQYHGDEQQFLKTWDQYDGNYALIKGTDFQLLIPKLDKEKVRNLSDYKNLDELIEHYSDIFAMYNQIAGFDNSTQLNQNGQNRYFLKADAHGAGGAYYSSNWAANTAKTTDMWLKKNDWATLHEIAHGYQAGFDGVGMYTGEVSNNLFGVQYQYAKYGKKADQIGWLFNYGKRDAVENGLYKDLIMDHRTYSSINLREKLILLTMLKQSAGNDSFTKMYQQYRQLANQVGFNKKDYPLPDLMNQVYSENSHQDFTPVLESWGLNVNQTQAEKNRVTGYPAVSSLTNVIPKDKLPSARTLIDPKLTINSNFEMVQDKDIAPLGLKGDLSLNLDADDMNDLLGSKVLLKDGSNTVATQTISGDTVSFQDVPNGVYTLEFQGKPMSEYIANKHYVYVKEANNLTSVSLDKIQTSNLANQEFKLLGLSDSQFGTLNINLGKKEAILDITKTTPHSYYKNKKYVELTVKDKNGVIKYNETINGTDATVSKDKISLNIGDQIDLYHAETKNRLISNDSNIIDAKQNINHWKITKWGLENTVLKNDPQQDLIQKINQLGGQLIQQDSQNFVPLEISTNKKQMKVAILSLDEPYRTQALAKWGILFN